MILGVLKSRIARATQVNTVSDAGQRMIDMENNGQTVVAVDVSANLALGAGLARSRGNGNSLTLTRPTLQIDNLASC